MRRLALLAVGLLLGALAVTGQEAGRDEDLSREIDKLRTLLRERIEKKTPQAEAQLVSRAYDVADLCVRLQDRSERLENVRPSNEQQETPEVAEPAALFELDWLVEILKAGAEPQSWEIEGSEIQPQNGRLFVTAIPRVHRKIEALLRWCRMAVNRRVAVEVVALPLREGDTALLSDRPRELTEAEAKSLLSRDPLGSVTLVGFDGKLLGGRGGREISYVQDYDVEVGKGAAIGDPVRATVFAGCAAEVRASLDDDTGAILDCQLEFSRIAEPIPVQPTEHGDVELPTKQLTRIQSSFWAPLGKTVVAGGCTVGEDPCVILVTARRK